MPWTEGPAGFAEGPPGFQVFALLFPRDLLPLVLCCSVRELHPQCLAFLQCRLQLIPECPGPLLVFSELSFQRKASHRPHREAN